MSRATIRVHDDGWSRLHLRWFCDDTLLWRDMLNDFKATFPHWTGRSYDAESRFWSVPRSQRQRLQTWADAWVRRSGQEWTYEDDDEPASNTRQGSQSQSLSALNAAYRTLHLLPSAPLWAAEAVYRAAAKHVHPDAGGDHEAAKAVNAAIVLTRAHQERAKSA